MKRKNLIGQILLVAGIITVTLTFIVFNLKAQTEKLPSNKKEPPKFGELRIVNEGGAFSLKPAGYFSYYNHLDSARDYKDQEFVTGEGVFACTLSNIPVWSDYDLYLLDCKKEIIARSENYGTDDEYIWQDVSIGLYYVRVYCYSGGNPTQNYHLFGQSPDQTIVPDFRILSISASDSNPIIGTNISLKVTVVNFSACTTSLFYTSLFKNLDEPPTAPACWGEYNFTWWQLGSFEQHEFTQDFVTSYTPTTWRVYGLVDCDNRTIELNECNNSKGPLQIVWREPPPQPDLSVQVFPSSLTPKLARYDYLYTDVTVRNIGNATAGGFWTDIFYNRIDSPTPPASGDDWRYSGSLSPGYSTGFTFVTRNRGDQAESWHMYLLVDSQARIDESNENNNTYGPALITWGAASPSYPDRSRQDMTDAALTFVNAQWTPSSANCSQTSSCYDWSCDLYFSARIGQLIQGEAYEWGAWDRPGDFIKLLGLQPNPNELFKVGAYKENDCEPDETGDPFWAIGSDCAGLVSRAWNLSYRCGTTCLTGSYVTTQLANYKYLIRGDILDKPGIHVAMFYDWGGVDTMLVIEETPPKAILTQWLPTKYLSYTPYRYNHVLGVGDIPGDANSDGQVTVGDVIWLVNYLFKYGPPPSPMWKGDVNQDCRVTVADIVYLVNYLFKGGPPPKYGCAPG